MIKHRPAWLWVVVAVTLVSGQVLAVAVYRHSQAVERHQATVRHVVDGVLRTGTPRLGHAQSPRTWSRPVALTAPDGRSVVVTVPIGADQRAGDHLPVWVYADGRPTVAPEPTAAAMSSAVIVGLLSGMLAAVAAMTGARLRSWARARWQVRDLDREWAQLLLRQGAG
jgi:uncharacterized protein (DUF3084 family)